MGENAFHMVFQESWVFSHSSQNPALVATRLWAGYGELVGENSISPGKPCENHINCFLIQMYFRVGRGGGGVFCLLEYIFKKAYVNPIHLEWDFILLSYVPGVLSV